MDQLRQRLRSATGHGADKQTAAEATLSEVFPGTVTDGAGTGFVMTHLPRTDRPVLWVQDRLSLREAGRPYLAGLGHVPNLLCLTVSRAVDVLWAMEQGLGCGALAAVVGEVWGDAPALDFTASKRLAMRSEAHAIPAWLMRRAASPDLSAARDRWRLRSRPSDLELYNSRAPGAPRWEAELFRSRRRAPGTWVVQYDRSSHTLHFEDCATSLRRHPADQPTGLQAQG